MKKIIMAVLVGMFFVNMSNETCAAFHKNSKEAAFRQIVAKGILCSSGISVFYWTIQKSLEGLMMIQKGSVANLFVQECVRSTRLIRNITAFPVVSYGVGMTIHLAADACGNTQVSNVGRLLMLPTLSAARVVDLAIQGWNDDL